MESETSKTFNIHLR